MAASDATPSRRTRRRLAAAFAVACAVLAGGATLAQPRGGRMDPGEREQLRRELRQQRVERARGEDSAERPRNRLSPQELEQLRRQVREARPFEGRARGRGRN